MTLTLPRLATDNASTPTMMQSVGSGGQPGGQPHRTSGSVVSPTDLQPQTSTERAAAYERLHTAAAARLDASLRRFVRDLRRHGLAHGPAIQSAFISRHTLALARAYTEGHRAGQRAYWQQMSATPARHPLADPDVALVRRRMAFYAPSVAKMAREGVDALTRARHEANVPAAPQALAETYAGRVQLADDALTQWQDSLGARVSLQAELTWSGMQDGYGGAGAGDVANPYWFLYWVLGPVKTEHCVDCLSLAANSPYNRPGVGGTQLEQTPGDGRTECGAGCKCFLSYEAPGEIEQRLWDGIAQQLPPYGGEADQEQQPSPTVAPPPASGQLAVTQRQALDALRQAIDGWNLVRGELLPALPPFATPQQGLTWEIPYWEVLTVEQQDALHAVAAALRLWNNAASLDAFNAAVQAGQLGQALFTERYGVDGALLLYNPYPRQAHGRFGPGGMHGQREHEGFSRHGGAGSVEEQVRAHVGGGPLPRGVDIQHAGHGIRVEYGAGAQTALHFLFGRTLSHQEVADLVGAQPGSYIHVTSPVRSNRMATIHTWGRGFDPMHAAQSEPHAEYESIRTVLHQRGKLTIYGDWLRVREDLQGGGMGTYLMRDYVSGARRLGVSRLMNTAARIDVATPNQPRMNGYYTWARMGYNAALSHARMRAPLPAQFAGVRTIRQLMRTQAGRDWWKQYGDTTGMEFNLRTNSQSMRTFNAYLRTRGLPPV